MIQVKPLVKKNVASIGEEIGLELGNQMVKDFQVANPNEAQYYTIGRNIIDQILAQPGCVGLRFYNAYNEVGEKTLVYVGLNAEGKAILQYSVINNEGVLASNKGIVADRTERGGRDSGSFDADNWNWEIA